MSQAYAQRGRDDTATGRVILIISSSLATLLVVAGVLYALGIGHRHTAALAAADCEPGLAPAGIPCTTVQMMTSQYLAIMTPAGQQHTADVTAYTASEARGDLVSAKVALNAEVAADHAFGTGLNGLQFPPSVAPLARNLARANQACAALIATQAKSASLTQLRSYDARVHQANSAVQAQMAGLLQAIRRS
jgi:hypothetical protein